jgi:NhaP-type Na+/H+ or K+/H+ antiporter
VTIDSAGWFVLVGGLMLVMGLTAPLIRRLPVTTAIVYLVVGLVIGPTGLGLFHFNPLEQSALLEILTELVVLLSLFSAGVKMPVPVSFRHWRAPVLLATVSMAVSVGLVAGFAHWAFGMSVGAAVLLGAIVAPTDPVLATEVQIRHGKDRDSLRFTLTCEAGMNDGTAFPFVMLGLGLLGLHELGNGGQRWLIMDLAWATLSAIVVGMVAGWCLAQAVARLRGQLADSGLLHDFLGLGLIGLVYGICLWIGAWGFIAVFVAAVGLRHTEIGLATEAPGTAAPEQQPEKLEGQHVSEKSLVFGEHLERLAELVLLLLIGGMLFLDSWSLRAAGFALFVLLVARPVSVMAAMLGTRTSWRISGLTSWFGVRGIGSLYYLMYAIQHGIEEELAVELIHLVLILVAFSILAHGISVKPLLERFSQPGSET